MKLLLDQNISYKILPSVSVFYPESTHVRIEHLEGKTDGEIWNYAKEQGFTIVTQDADFYEITLLKGLPPKILWLRCGNTSTQTLNVFSWRTIQQLLNFSQIRSTRVSSCIDTWNNE